ncbi:MAG: glycosyltransferase family 4 protein, partial [Chloroflexi bacterium]|nr:glycosyltransferase family 4 protein [Chloroflexota bacterium]
MRLLIAHNYYLQPGGEDQAYRHEINLLRSQGNDVYEFHVHNTQIAEISKLKLALNTIWSAETYRKIQKIITNFKPDLAHFHNTFPLISPSAYDACHTFNIPVVQTLHNYRLLCPSALLFRKHQPCLECLNKLFALPGIRYRCYHHSAMATAGVAMMQFIHHLRSTWMRRIDQYVVLTEFARRLFIEAGLPADKMIVKPNFALPASERTGNGTKHMLYVGRFSPEKGILLLIEMAKKRRGDTLVLIGDGPEKDHVSRMIKANNLNQVFLMGQQPRNKVLVAYQDARALIVPSLCYEVFGLVLAEAFSVGVPVIASRLGAMAEIVEDGKTGLLFTPGDAEDLAAKVEWAWNHPAEMAEMGKAARR